MKDQLDIAKGGIINLTGSVFNQGLSLAATLTAARLFQVEQFGIYSLAIALVSLLQIFGSAGMRSGIVKFVSEYHTSSNTNDVYQSIGSVFRWGIIINTVLAAVLYVSAPMVAEIFFSKPELSDSIRIMSFTLPFFFGSVVFLHSCMALRIMKYQHYADGIRIFIFIALLFTLFFFRAEKHSLAYAYLGSWIGGSFASLLFFSRQFSLSLFAEGIYKAKLSNDIIKFSIPQTFSDILNALLSNLTILLIGLFLPPDAAGIYRIANKIADLIQVSLRAVRGIFAPIISSLSSQGQTMKLGDIFSTVTRWLFTINLPLIFLMTFFAADLLGFFGPAYRSGFMTMIIISIGCFISASAGNSDYILIMSGKPRSNLYTEIISITVSLFLNLLLIPAWGITGAAIATAASIAAASILRLHLVYRDLHIHPYSASFVKPLASWTFAVSISMAFHYYSVHYADFTPASLLFIALFVSIYGVFIFLFGIEKGDRALLSDIFSRTVMDSR
jgi:O-antigen/teichoic acid export membrane protein